jgi:hypothetical protein
VRPQIVYLLIFLASVLMLELILHHNNRKPSGTRPAISADQTLLPEQVLAHRFLDGRSVANTDWVSGTDNAARRETDWYGHWYKYGRGEKAPRPLKTHNSVHPVDESDAALSAHGRGIKG